MKKHYILLLISTALLFTNLKAQTFSQGDVSLMLQPMMNHDSTQCSSMCQMFYAITINNSFLGDSVKVKDQFGGFIVYEEENTTGANPWTIFAPVYNGSSVVPDNQVSGGIAVFGNGSTNKVISGTDTIYNIVNIAFLPVPNPCLYSTVSGNVYVDYNNDCSFNGTDVPLNNVLIQVNENLNSPSMTTAGVYGGTNANGNYTASPLLTWMVNYTVSIPPFYQFIFPSSSCSPIPVYSGSTLPNSNVNFSLQCTSNIDVQCYAGSTGIVRPLTPFLLHPYVSNTGCNPASGTLKLVLDSRVTYNSTLSSNLPNSVSGDTLIWNYSNLNNLSNGAYWNSFFSSVHLTPNASVNIGDTLCFRIFTNVPTGDINTNNNDYTICLPVINSHDPNLKEVSPKGIGAAGEVPLTTDELTYTIHFQNTGSALAYHVRVVDTLNSNIDASTLRILGCNHSLTSPEWLAPNVVRFNFFNINLPDSTTNEPKSHGFIRFSVKLNNALPQGTVINNNASIYFDTNPAIVTNTVTNTLGITSGINNISNTDYISVYPNPSIGLYTITTKSKAQSIKVYNILGEMIYQSNPPAGGPKSEINITSQPKGIYFYKINLTNGEAVNGKLIKE